MPFVFGAQLREKAEDLNEALLEFHAAEWARRKADKEAMDAYEAHLVILSKIRRLAERTVALRRCNLRLQRLESRALADSFRLLRATVEAEELVARLEAERVERVGEEEDDDEKTDWREVAQDDLNDSELELGSLNYPRQHAGAGLPQDLREVPKDAAVEALLSLVRAAAGPELKFRAGVETTAGELAAATTSGAGLAKKQSKVFDPGGGL